MYGSNMEQPSLMLSYDSAFRKWKSIAPIRGRQDQNTRPLARRGNDNLTIRQDPTNKDIIVQLYSTDIITYDANGDGNNNLIHLEPYASSLTNRVVWSILGPRVNTYWSDRYRGPGLITEVNGRYYHTPSYAVIQPDQSGWTLVEGAKPVEVPYLNRKEGRRALKDTDYYTFKLWLETRVKLGIAEFGHRYGPPFSWTPSQAVQYLRQGEAGWAEIAARMSNSVPLDAELRSLREAVYQYEMCYDAMTFEYFETHQQMQNAIDQIARVG